MAWYNSSWDHRKKITVQSSQVNANLTDFPVLVNLASDADIAAAARSDGYDFVVTRSDETTECAYERVFYDNTTGQLVLWFLANSLSSLVNTDFYLYYGNLGQASDKQDMGGTWPANYKGVWHLDESSGTRSDSSGNGNDLSDNNTVTQGTGKIYQAADFTVANSEYLSITDASQTGLDTTGDNTLQCWVNFDQLPSTYGTNMALITKHTGSGSAGAYFYNVTTTDKPTHIFYNDPAATASGTETTSAEVVAGDVGNFIKLDMVLDVSAPGWTFYKNGSSVGDTPFLTNATAIRDSAATFVLGANSEGSNQFFDGLIEEARVYSGLLTSDWIATEYNNQNSPGTFYSLGTEEVAPAPQGGMTLLGVS